MAKKSTGRALAPWDEDLARAAAASKERAASLATGQFMSTKSGQLSYNGSPFPGNKVAAIIVAWGYENTFYEGAYNPDAQSSPSCFAFGLEQKTMEPHENVVRLKNAQHDRCGIAGRPGCCPQNEFATASTGKGKACGNRIRLALVAAGGWDNHGKFEPDGVEEIEGSNIVFLRVPPTSLQGFASYVNVLDATVHRPPHGVFTEISIVPSDVQFSTVFKPLGKIGDEYRAAVEARVAEAEGALFFPYPDYEPAAPTGRGGRGAPAPRAARGAAKPEMPVAGRGRKF